MGSPGKDLRSGLIICACSRGEGLENSSGEVQQELGQGALRRPVLARNQGVNPVPGLICFHRPRAGEGHWA